MEPCFTPDQAYAEAGRCLLCFDAPCSKGCPAGTDPGTFIRKLRLRNIKGAIATVKNNNILGGICGILCPVSGLCEKECAATPIDRPIQIGRVQRFLIEHGRKLKFNPLEKKEPNNINIAIIGCGPSGLSCAAELAKEGFSVDIFEKKPKPGGVMRYLIPDHRLSKEFLNEELKDISSLGVNIRYKSPVESGEELEKLLKEGYRAVYIATGTWGMKSLGLASVYKGFYNAKEFLEKCKSTEKPDMKKIISGKRVCVIGGGDTAIDAAESALILDAKDVSIVYRRSFAQMPGDENGKIEALKSGINFLILTQPVKYLTNGGRITGIEAVRNKLGTSDTSGRPRPVPISGSSHIISTDIIIEAIGFGPEDDSKMLFEKFKLSEKGLILVDEKTGTTSKKSFYAGGDITRGPSLIPEAVADGKRAAKAILEDMELS
ncbi:MAG: FAD-dependent oxidoreductase [Spirochaetota bacterium]|nr:MAG: FAD-dependent oxidoreductase [Spirochaetota bacterium]